MPARRTDAPTNGHAGRDRTSERLDPSERKEAEERQRVDAPVLHEAIKIEGDEELRRPASALAWSALAAGMSMGFSQIAAGLLERAVPAAPWKDLVVAVGYTAGFLFVILGRQQLFTENTVTPVLPLLVRRDARTLRALARLWGVVLAGNLTGGLIVAGVIAWSGAFDETMQASLTAVARAATDMTPGVAFARGIFAGWLLALLVWLLPSVEDAGRVLVILLVTYLVGAGHFAHSVAGAVDGFYLVLTGQLAAAGLVVLWVPTVLGNVIGGTILVALLGHKQVVSG